MNGDATEYLGGPGIVSGPKADDITCHPATTWHWHPETPIVILR